MALETANDGITCNAICPGWVLTPLVQKQIDARAKEQRQVGRRGKKWRCCRKSSRCTQFTTPENIGALAVFLCSDDAATITGSAYSIDGGWVAQ